MREILSYMAIAIVTVAGTVLIRKAQLWLDKRIETEKAKAAEADNGAKLKALTFAETAIDRVVESVVGKIEQTTASDLRKAVKAGKADREELTILSKDAYYEIIDILQDSVLNQIQQVIGDYETYIAGKIENQVRLVKLSEKESCSNDAGASEAALNNEPVYVPL